MSINELSIVERQTTEYIQLRRRIYDRFYALGMLSAVVITLGCLLKNPTPLLPSRIIHLKEKHNFLVSTLAFCATITNLIFLISTGNGFNRYIDKARGELSANNTIEALLQVRQKATEYCKRRGVYIVVLSILGNFGTVLLATSKTAQFSSKIVGRLVTAGLTFSLECTLIAIGGIYYYQTKLRLLEQKLQPSQVQPIS